MNNIIFVFITIGLLLGYLSFRWYISYSQKQKVLKAKQKHDAAILIEVLLDFIKLKIPIIQNAKSEFSQCLTNENGYFSNHAMAAWKLKHTELHKEIKDQPFESLQLKAEEIDTIRTFLDYYRNAATLRTEFNKQFILYELESQANYFRNIEKHGLDKDQQTAVITDDDNSIVIAGAGSGKTTTIVGKVNYVIDRYKTPPNEILLISFTAKSAETLAKRINIEGVEAKTFHKFGKDVICEVENRQPGIFDEKQYKNLLTRFFKELIQNQDYLSKLTQYFTDYLKEEKQQDDFEDQGAYIQYMKDQNFHTYKTKEIHYQGRTTYKKEVVKSIEECKIANFLLFNSVEYEYELPYEHDTATQEFRQYKPDFTINPESERVYVEHFGINKKGQVPHFFADTEKGQTVEQVSKEYTDKITWKRELHQKHNTLLIETFSHEMHDEVLFDRLTLNLTKAGIKLIPKSPQEIWKIISAAAKEEIDSFITLIQTFITLMKSNNYSITDLLDKNKTTKDKFHKKRNAAFLEIITPIFEKYEHDLKSRNEIDFSDMINIAANYIAGNKFKRKFSYVIIDEFQYISIGRYQLIKAIKDNNPACKLFCVGDDWQSIYRFSGSDIALFKHFERYFGHTVKSKIETTYRFHEPLISFSSNFILKNPNQVKKDLKSIAASKTTNHKIVYSKSDYQDDTFAILSILNELILTPEIHKKEILILGRFSFDIDRLKNGNNILQIDKETSLIRYKNLRIQFMTIHKAKGLEADVIIVLNCNSGKHGFPSEMSDDPVLNLLLSEADQYENGEERRLFYVALTRAKDMVYLVADAINKSKFITELEAGTPNSPIKKCPKCKTADAVKRSGTKNGKQWAFYGCSNYLYGCDYKEWV